MTTRRDHPAARAAARAPLTGAHLGATHLPPHLVALLETSPKGRDYLRELAGNLFTTCRGVASTSGRS